MVPRINYALMVVLILGLLAGVTALAITSNAPRKTQPAPEEIEGWIRELASPDSDVVDRARGRLIRLGPLVPVERLREAAASSDPALSKNAREVLELLFPAPPADPES